MKKKILEAVKARLGDEYEVRWNEVKKNNGIVWHGVSVMKKGENCALQIYIDDLLDESVDEIADFVVSKFKEVEENKDDLFPKMDEIKQKIMTKDGLLSNVFPALVNRERNESRFETVVHRPYLDMEVEFKVDVGDNGFITVDKKLAELAGVTEDELYAAALGNIKGTAKVKDMFEMLPEEMRPEGPCPSLIVLTNEDNLLGAGVILDSLVIEYLTDKYGDFFLLPSSVHEMLVIPKKMGNAKELKRTVRDVNTTLEDRDYLSDSVYICKNGKIEVA